MLHAVSKSFSILPGNGEIVEFEHVPDSECTVSCPACYVHRCRENAPIQVFLNGHVDTVYDKNHPFQDCEMQENGTLRGPGITDMKGGIVILLAALELFEAQVQDPKIGWEVVLTCDEEIGSVQSRPLLKEAAARNHLGITFESSLPDGKLVRKRMGVGYGHAKVLGTSAHVGRNFDDGRNAIVKLSHWITHIHALNQKIPGAIINTGSIHGGGPLNVVSEEAEARFNLRVEDAQAEQALFEALSDIHRSMKEEGYDCQWEAHLNRKAKETGPTFDALFGAWNQAAEALGQTLDWRDTGGGSDGNILQAAGLPIIDNLGMIGDKIHSPNEYAVLSSITERTTLVATFLMMLSAGDFDHPKSNELFARQLKQMQLQQNSQSAS